MFQFSINLYPPVHFQFYYIYFNPSKCYFFFTVHSNTQNQYSGTSMTMYPTGAQGFSHAPPPPMYNQPAGYPQYPPPQYPAHVSGGIHPAYPPNPAYPM